jgi:hypothetical protein
VKPDPEVRDEEEGLNEGVLKSIVRSIFLRHRLNKKEEQSEHSEDPHHDRDKDCKYGPR